MIKLKKKGDIIMIRKLIKYFKSKKALSSYSYGDVIWCKIKKYGDQFNFVDNHQIRPFLFVKYEKRRIYGYTLTHTIPNKNTLAYPLKSHDGDYALLMCLFELKTSSFEGLSEHLDEKDLSDISKIIYNMYDDKVIKAQILNTIKLDVNDIVLYKDEKYLVYAIDAKRLTLYKLLKEKNEIKIIHKKNIYYLSNKALIVDISDVIFSDKFNDDIRSLLKNARKENKVQNKTSKNLFCPGDIYKTGSGRYLVLEVKGDKLLVTKYGNPDYVVKNTTAVGKQKIGSISEESLNEFKIKLSKIAEVFG